MGKLTQARTLALGFGWLIVVNLVGVLAFRRHLHATVDLPPAAEPSIAPLFLVWFAVLLIPLALLGLAYRAQARHGAQHREKR